MPASVAQWVLYSSITIFNANGNGGSAVDQSHMRLNSKVGCETLAAAIIPNPDSNSNGIRVKVTKSQSSDNVKQTEIVICREDPE